jgi:hypothetical protein
VVAAVVGAVLAAVVGAVVAAVVGAMVACRLVDSATHCLTF